MNNNNVRFLPTAITVLLFICGSSNVESAALDFNTVKYLGCGIGCSLLVAGVAERGSDIIRYTIHASKRGLNRLKNIGSKGKKVVKKLAKPLAATALAATAFCETMYLASKGVFGENAKKEVEKTEKNAKIVFNLARNSTVGFAKRLGSALKDQAKDIQETVMSASGKLISLIREKLKV